MFLRLYFYRLKDILFTKEIAIWNIFFPIILGTFFYLGFSNLMNESDLKLSPIPAAVVTESENTAFSEVLTSLCEEGDDQLFDAVYTDLETAKTMLNDNDVTGIIFIADTPHLMLNDNGIEQTIMQSFIQQYCNQADVLKEIAMKHPEKLKQAIDTLTSDITYGHEISLANASYDPYMQYFYALIAMTCLFSASAGVHCLANMQANQSSLGMRREVAPVHKLTSILSDISATFTIQFLSVLLLFFYLIVILGIDFGQRIILIILTAFLGTLISLMTGLFIGAVVKKNEAVQTSIALVYSMGCSFLSGLMVEAIKDWIEHTCPIINRINPAALITDSLYALNMFESYDRYIRNTIILAVMAVILCLISYLLLRRTKYASL